MNNAKKQTVAIFIALMSAIVGSWGRIKYELESLSGPKRFIVGVAFALILTLTMAWIITSYNFQINGK